MAWLFTPVPDTLHKPAKTQPSQFSQDNYDVPALSTSNLKSSLSHLKMLQRRFGSNIIYPLRFQMTFVASFITPRWRKYFLGSVPVFIYLTYDPAQNETEEIEQKLEPFASKVNVVCRAPYRNVFHCKWDNKK